MTRSFDEWIPRHDEGIGFDQFLLVDLLPYHKSFHKQGIMDFDIAWSAPCRPGWLIQVFAIVEAVYEKSKEHGWLLRPVIN